MSKNHYQAPTMKDITHNPQENNPQAYGTLITRRMQGYNRQRMHHGTRLIASPFIGEDIPSRHAAQTIIPESYAAESKAHQQALALAAMRKELYALAPHEKEAFAEREAQLREEKAAQVETAWQMHTIQQALTDTSTSGFRPLAHKTYASEKRALDALKANKPMTFFGYTLEQLAPVRASIRTYVINLAQQEGAELSQEMRDIIDHQYHIANFLSPSTYKTAADITKVEKTIVLNKKKVVPNRLTPVFSAKPKQKTLEQKLVDGALEDPSGIDEIGPQYVSPGAAVLEATIFANESYQPDLSDEAFFLVDKDDDRPTMPSKLRKTKKGEPKIPGLESGHQAEHAIEQLYK